MNRSKQIFNNPIATKVYKKARRTKMQFKKKFGDDSATTYFLKAEENPILGELLGVKTLVASDVKTDIDYSRAVLLGNIRMGFGHYRISIAMASAAKALGYTPYWFDLHSFEETTGAKIISHLNNLYSLGSKLSQNIALFDKFYWEPLNSEGFRKLDYNAVDQKTTELMTPIFSSIPKDIPYVATHVWPAQAAIHAGMERVVNAIPDNWQMALHLSEGAVHTVQSPSAFLGYKTLRGMDGKTPLNPMPQNSLHYVGHYIDHELVENLPQDISKRIDRLESHREKRYLLTVGGAGAQKDLFSAIIRKILPYVNDNKASLLINVGDHKNVWESLSKEIPELQEAKMHFGDFKEVKAFCDEHYDKELQGIHAFYDEDIFSAVYTTNLLMRISDLLVTKPSELAFYPIPKLLIKRVGGHEAWGAIRSSEVGDGTFECDSIKETESMIELIQRDDSMLRFFCENILKNHEAKLYHGAYEVIKLAIKKEID